MADYNYIGNTDTLYILNKLKAVLDGSMTLGPGYVQKVTGKGLSTNDLTNELLTKLNNSTAVAWNQIAASSGTKIAEITINGSKIDIYVPASTVITVDTQMSDVSENAVQNRVIKQYVDDAVGSVVSIEFRKVNSLPVTGENGVIYLVPKSGTPATGNVYEEYIWIAVDSSYEKIGETTIDLSNYVQKSDLAEVTTADIDTMFTTVFGTT